MANLILFLTVGLLVVSCHDNAVYPKDIVKIEEACKDLGGWAHVETGISNSGKCRDGTPVDLLRVPK